jgi:hypothetical protein
MRRLLPGDATPTSAWFRPLGSRQIAIPLDPQSTPEAATVIHRPTIRARFNQYARFLGPFRQTAAATTAVLGDLARRARKFWSRPVASIDTIF